jgi:hypothetical protein
MFAFVLLRISLISKLKLKLSKLCLFISMKQARFYVLASSVCLLASLCMYAYEAKLAPLKLKLKLS